MGYNIKLDNFEGPLDLLLHLIQKEELDIYDIPIAKITEQYLEYIHSIQKLDLEVASEFLVMAATLISIKARMLLPDKKDEDEEEEIDPREELVRHLVQYQKYKEVAEELKRRSEIMSSYVERPVKPDEIKELFSSEEPPLGVELKDLVSAFKRILKRNPKAFNKTLQKEKVTVAERIEYIQDVISKKPQGVFISELFDDAVTIRYIVVTFLAILELARMQQIKIIQYKNFGEITILPWQHEQGEG